MKKAGGRMEAAEEIRTLCGMRRQYAAVITGASSGIGAAVSRKLSGLGYEVFGIGREFAPDDFWQQEGVHAVACDLLDTGRLCRIVRQIAAECRVRVLVNNAGVGYYGLHEELNPDKIKELVRTNLEAPMILAQLLLRQLKKHAGWMVNIASVTAAKTNPHGCAYGATKAGLASFSASLFEEARKYGVKVVTISPDMTKTGLYRHADFREGEEADTYLLPEEVAEAVGFVLGQREGMAVTELTIRPQRHQIRRVHTDKNVYTDKNKKRDEGKIQERF